MAVILRDIRQAILIALLSVISDFKYSQTLPMKDEQSQTNWYNKYRECSYPVTSIVANKTSRVGEMCDSSPNQNYIEACSTLVNVSHFICMSNDTIPRNENFILDTDTIHQIVKNGSVCHNIKLKDNQKRMMQNLTQFSFLYKLKTEPDFCDLICSDKNTTYLCVLLLNGLQIIHNIQASKVATVTDEKVADQLDGLAKSKDISPMVVKEGAAANLSPSRDKTDDGRNDNLELAKSKLKKVETSTSNEILTTTPISKPIQEVNFPIVKNSAVDNSLHETVIKSTQKILSNSKSEIATSHPNQMKEAIPKEIVNTDNKKPLSMPNVENKQQSTEKIATTTTPTTLPKYETSIINQPDEVNKDNSDNAQIQNTIQETPVSNKNIEPSKTDTAETTKDASTLKDLERKDFQEENGKTDAPEGGLSGSNTKPIDDDSIGEEDNEETLEQPEDIINADKGQSIRGGGEGDDQVMDNEYTGQHVYANYHFFPYILTISVLCIIVYLIFHNKQKILAIIIEGKNKQRRRPNTSNYKKLDSNVEEVMHRPASAVTTAHIIY